MSLYSPKVGGVHVPAVTGTRGGRADVEAMDSVSIRNETACFDGMQNQRAEGVEENVRL